MDASLSHRGEVRRRHVGRRARPARPPWRPLLDPLSTLANALAALAVLIALWAAGVWLFEPYPFILPSPIRVGETLWDARATLAHHAGITAAEIALGLLLGTILGVLTALALNAWSPARRVLLPLVMASQALPVFAVAPLLVVWFGLGLGSKIAMATLIIYFPVASALGDGLERAEGDLVDLGRIYGASRLQLLLHIRLPAAMPALASGLRVAATVAPIGAIVGEGVGAAGGLGYLINQANARMQTDMTFAGLLVLFALVIALRLVVDAVLDRLVHWTPRTDRNLA